MHQRDHIPWRVYGGSGASKVDRQRLRPAGILSGGENTFIVAGKGDRVTVPGALTYVNAAVGSVTGYRQAAPATGTGAIEGASRDVNTNILAGAGSSIPGTGGAGSGRDRCVGRQRDGHRWRRPDDGVKADRVDLITGGGGNLQVDDLKAGVGGAEKITGGSGNLFVFQVGKSVTVTGSTLGTTFVDDSYSVAGAAVGGNSKITGGTGTATGTFEGRLPRTRG